MNAMFRFEPTRLPAEAEKLRGEVRDFLARQIDSGAFMPRSDFGVTYSAEFSRLLGQRGWIGMTWPRQYGGHERSMLERYVVTEELLAAGAPVFAHWIADRQSGPLILRVGTETQKQKYLPGIAKGEIYFSIGMSEPDSGSDLASIRTKAEKVEGGWRLRGRKVWTSFAHRNHYAITLVRTAPAGENKHVGLTQFIVDLKAPGVATQPIVNIAGDHEFNEVTFDDVFLPDDALLGAPGSGWSQVTSELAYERSGPERYLSSFLLFREFVRAAGPNPGERAAELIGRYAAILHTLRRMSVSVAGMLQRGEEPALEAALIKDLGNTVERGLPEDIRKVLPHLPNRGGGLVTALYHDAVLHAPSWTLRGGTREIMRGIIARGLGLR